MISIKHDKKFRGFSEETFSGISVYKVLVLMCFLRRNYIRIISKTFKCKQMWFHKILAAFQVYIGMVSKCINETVNNRKCLKSMEVLQKTIFWLAFCLTSCLNMYKVKHRMYNKSVNISKNHKNKRNRYIGMRFVEDIF